MITEIERTGVRLGVRFGVRVGGGLAARVALVAGVLGAGAVAAAGPTGPVEIIPSDAAAETRFGYAIAVDDERMLVGRLIDHDAGFRAGAAYVLRLEGGQWVEEGKLLDPSAVQQGHLGTSVAIDGDIAVVGAREVAGRVNIGGALVYRWSGDAWEYQVTLDPPDIMPPMTGFGYYGFGHAVGVSGDRVVVGMPQDDIACPEDPLCNSGSAYVFRLEGTAWVLEQKLIPSDPQRIAHFGRSVAMTGVGGGDGGRIVVGAFQADEVAGAVYVFRREGGAWVEEAKLVNPDAEPAVVTQFGGSVSTDGDLIAVGAPGENAGGAYAGAAYIFRDGPGGWGLEQKISAGDSGTLQFFGESVSVRGGRVLAGAPWDNHGGAMFRAGAAYLFERGPSVWSQREKLIDPATQDEDFFGWSVALSGDRAIVGAQLANRPIVDSGVVLVYDGVGGGCEADWNGDGAVNSSDISAFLTAWLGSVQGGTLEADFNGDLVVNSNDISAFLTAWLAAVSGGC